MFMLIYLMIGGWYRFTRLIAFIGKSSNEDDLLNLADVLMCVVSTSFPVSTYSLYDLPSVLSCLHCGYDGL